MLPASIEAADSWLVVDGTVRGLDLHRTRLMTSIPRGRYRQVAPDAFWDGRARGDPPHRQLVSPCRVADAVAAAATLFRLRDAPELKRSIVLTTHTGRDPRTAPGFKGPDLDAMTRLRTDAQDRGADEAVIVTPQGFIAEGSTTSLAWWRGESLCVPSTDIAASMGSPCGQCSRSLPPSASTCSTNRYAGRARRP